jgi:hypothetical protein
VWQQEFVWFLTIFHHECRKNNPIAFEVRIVLAVAHVFGFYNPKQLADCLDVPPQQFSTELQDWSVYQGKKMRRRFMVKHAAEKLKPVMSQSAATRSRAGTTFSIDNSVMDRCGNLLRCPWSWESGRYHHVIRGQDLLGLGFTIHPLAFPLPLLFCPTQGRSHTTKADVLLCMLTQRKTACLCEGMDITQLPVTMDAAYGSQARRARLHQLGCIDSIMAGKGNDVLTIDAQQWEASTGKNVRMFEEPPWGIDVPSCRIGGESPTLGSRMLCFLRTSTTRSDDLMHLSQRSLRGAAIWHIWQQPHVIACFWKSMKSLFQLRALHLQGDGVSTALLIKVCASLLALRVKAQGVFSTLTITEIMRTWRREEDVRDFLVTHCHAPFSIG